MTIVLYATILTFVGFHRVRRHENTHTEQESGHTFIVLQEQFFKCLPFHFACVSKNFRLFCSHHIATKANRCRCIPSSLGTIFLPTIDLNWPARSGLIFFRYSATKKLTSGSVCGVHAVPSFKFTSKVGKAGS